MKFLKNCNHFLNNGHSLQRLLKATFASALFFAAGSAATASAQRMANLRTQEPSWHLVTGGTVVSDICDTSYGFAFLNEGRVVCAISKNGTLLWQKPVKGAPTPYMTAYSDFLLVVTGTDTLNFVNPSGLTLWSAKVGFEITENPLCGADGRIFVRGKEYVACYGLQGSRKWQLRMEPQRSDIPLLPLNDGSLLSFLETQENGKSRAQRITPYGEPGEVAVFTAYVTAACACSQGVAVALSGAAVGLCAVKETIVESQWHTGPILQKDGGYILALADGENIVCISQTGSSAVATIVAIADGSLIAEIPLGSLSLSSLTLLRTTATGVCIGDTQRALEWGSDGTVFWEATLPDPKSLVTSFYTKDNTLIFCRKDWLMNAFVMSQSIGVKEEKITPVRTYVDTKAPTGTINQLDLERISPETFAVMRRAMQAGDYGRNEKEWNSLVQQEMRNWIYDMNQIEDSPYAAHSYFEENPVYVSNILEAAAGLETADYAELYAELLSVEKRNSVCVEILRACAKLGWDDDGVMLTQIENLMTQHRFTAKDTLVLKMICDVTYEICRYMGKPVLIKKGKNILAHLFYPNFNSTTRDYARKTFQRLAALEM